MLGGIRSWLGAYSGNHLFSGWSVLGNLAPHQLNSKTRQLLAMQGHQKRAVGALQRGKGQRLTTETVQLQQCACNWAHIEFALPSVCACGVPAKGHTIVLSNQCLNRNEDKSEQEDEFEQKHRHKCFTANDELETAKCKRQPSVTL